MTDTLLSAARRKIGIGDPVMVAYPDGEKTNNPAHSLDGQEFIIKSVHRIAENKNSRVTRVYYELHGAKSSMGIHYAFLEDELIRL